jgi:hypothetical protein
LRVRIFKEQRPGSFMVRAYRKVAEDDYPVGKPQVLRTTLDPVVRGGKTVAWDARFRVSQPSRDYYLVTEGHWRDREGRDASSRQACPCPKQNPSAVRAGLKPLPRAFLKGPRHHCRHPPGEASPRRGLVAHRRPTPLAPDAGDQWVSPEPPVEHLLPTQCADQSSTQLVAQLHREESPNDHTATRRLACQHRPV